ncbi:MAG TPA: flagellar protein FlaG [Chromatiales bacterium]|nr:flagellar protein FlaG [Thiotrichales bacterium]HIP69404.1 flagellar protein FlaG [Chromatiales bacterium]
MASESSIAPIQATQTLSGFGNYRLLTQPEPENPGNHKPVSGKELPVTATSEEPSQTELKKFISALNEIGESEPPHLQFSVDEDTGHNVITMTLKETGEVIRQMPSKEFLAIAKMIMESNEKLNDQPGRWIETEA